ncbi:GAF domain-containing sensor histidine kinase [Aerosakkonema funiforme]|uniref:GAF domain-containing sensor histidine kinase n=1 Tax=Aerosakkonema funiforme TaxID=1246630 RepID=UPI0035B70026
MVNPENTLFYRLNGLTPQAREQQRLLALTESGLLEAETIPIFDEATQTAAHFLDAPICILGIMDKDRQWFKSSVGLSRLGLMNKLATSRQLSRQESLCTHVVDSHKVLAIGDTTVEPIFAKSLLVQHYGIRAYLGVPLLTSTGHCLGTLAVMERVPRSFTDRETEFLELMARWIMSEFERNRALKDNAPGVLVNLNTQISSGNLGSQQLATNQIQVKLLGQLTQELRTPLTSVMGMASVLSREIYGPLTTKQKEYLEIIQHSGQYLLSLVNEILALGSLNPDNPKLNISAVDIEMLCQQAIATLEEAANRRGQQIRLSVEPGNRIWQLDKEKVRQLLYHLVSSVLQTADAGSIVRIHISRKVEGLNIAVWVSHPWLGDGLPHLEPYLFNTSVPSVPTYSESLHYDREDENLEQVSFLPAESAEKSSLNKSEEKVLVTAEQSEDLENNIIDRSSENLGLLLSCHLAQMHGGQISIQGSQESGFRYVVSLPTITETDVNI